MVVVVGSNVCRRHNIPSQSVVITDFTSDALHRHNLRLPYESSHFLYIHSQSYTAVPLTTVQGRASTLCLPHRPHGREESFCTHLVVPFICVKSEFLCHHSV